MERDPDPVVLDQVDMHHSECDVGQDKTLFVVYTCDVHWKKETISNKF